MQEKIYREIIYINNLCYNNNINAKIQSNIVQYLRVNMLINIEFNPVSLILLVPVIIILFSSLFMPFNHERILNGFYSVINSFEFIGALIIALILTTGILFDKDN